MTELLKEAVDKLQALPAPEQDAIARMVLEEIESERRWDELFERTSDQFARLADRAWAEHEAGQSEPLDPDML
jgi:hypothetical protein